MTRLAKLIQKTLGLNPKNSEKTPAKFPARESRFNRLNLGTQNEPMASRRIPARMRRRAPSRR